MHNMTEKFKLHNIKMKKLVRNNYGFLLVGHYTGRPISHSPTSCVGILHYVLRERAALIVTSGLGIRVMSLNRYRPT